MGNYFLEIDLLEKLINLHKEHGDDDAYTKYLRQAIELSGNNNDIPRHVDYLHELAESHALNHNINDYFSTVYKAISISEENNLIDTAALYLDEMITMCESHNFYDFYDYALNKKLEFIRR